MTDKMECDDIPHNECNNRYGCSGCSADVGEATPGHPAELSDGLVFSVERAIIDNALKMAVDYGGFDGAHHKDWVIDQMIRILAGDGYNKLVADACDGEDGPNTYTWDCGIAP